MVRADDPYSIGDRPIYYLNNELLVAHNTTPKLLNGNLYSVSAEKGAPLNWIPFQYNNNGFIIQRRDNGYVMLANPKNQPYLHTMDTDLRVPMVPYKRNFCVYVQRFGSKHYVVAFDSPLLALYFAWRQVKFPKRRALVQNDLCQVGFEINHHYKILKPVIELIQDREYNELVGAKEYQAPEYPEHLYSEEYPGTHCPDEVLYQHFKKCMLDTIEQPGTDPTNWGSHSNSVGSLETFPGEELLLRTSKRNIPFSYVTQCVDANGFPPLVTRFPKSGCVTSSGKVRSIYCMNILYENVLRRYFKNRKPKVPFEVIKGRDFGRPRKYMYDIKGCDVQVLPYIARFAQENGTKWMIPKVVDPLFKSDHRAYYIDQFPSGVFHTTIVTVCYTAALCLSLGLNDAVIQGDGFATDHQPQADFRIRTDDTFNGFKWNGRVWAYARAHRLNEFKFLRGNGPKGVMKYIITRWAYGLMDAQLPPDPTAPRCAFDPAYDLDKKQCLVCGQLLFQGLHFHHMDNDLERALMIGELYSDPGCIVRTAMAESGYLADTRKNNWDTFPLQPVEVDMPKGEVLYEREKF